MDYDVIIIGAGPGGYSAALNAARNGLKVVIIEKEKIGGVCLNEGCIPTKSLLYSAKIFETGKNGEKYGVEAESIKINQETVINRKNKIVRTLAAGIKSALKTAGVTTVTGNARLARSKNGLICVTAEETVYTAENIIIATGSSPVMPDIKGVKEMYEKGFVLTNKEILNINEIPETLVIVGGGVIGLEMASYFNSVGAKVSVIEMMPKTGGNMDDESADNLMKNYRKKGVNFLLNAKLIEVGENFVVYEKDGKQKELYTDKTLMSVGRAPNVADLGFESIGVAFDNKGIKTDDKCATTVKGIYAVGDVNGKIMLAHTAYREADVCVNNILGLNDNVDYINMPSVIYTNPEAASVGETEKSASEKGYDCETVKISMRYSGRYLAENEGGDGFCKIIFDKKRKALLGVHMVANYASEIIYGAGLMIRNKTEINDLKNIVFPHPSVSEIMREALSEIKI